MNNPYAKLTETERAALRESLDTLIKGASIACTQSFHERGIVSERAAFHLGEYTARLCLLDGYDR